MPQTPLVWPAFSTTFFLPRMRTPSKSDAKPQALVVQTLDSTTPRINYYPADKCEGNQLPYPLDSDLSSGYRYPPFEQLGPD